MKKTYLKVAALFAALLAGSSAFASTDVTATYLINADFDTAPITYTVSGGTTRNAAAVRIGSSGWIFEIPGWTNASVVPSNAVQVATGEYGTVANSQGFNNVPVPATDKGGLNTGAALSMSAGWNDKASYYQAVNLSSGKYVLKFDVYNAFTVAAITNNYCGFIPDAGTATYSATKSFPVATWITDSIVFTLTEQTAGRINLGMTTSAGSSGAGAKVFIDHVKLISYGVDKTGLKTLIDAANDMLANKKDVGTSTVYTELETVTSSANTVYVSVSSTIVDVVNAENGIKDAIVNVNNAALLQGRINTWTSFPVEASSAIENPSFESGFNGWTNVGLATQSNTSFAKTGNIYVEKWQASGSLTGLKVSQMVKFLPNGIYKVTLAAMEATGTTGGAYVFANGDSTQVFATNDYAVTTKVVNNTLELGFKVIASSNWVAMDNFRLSYISDGSPYIILGQNALSFTPVQTQKTLHVSGGNIENDATLTVSDKYTLSAATVTAAQINAGVDVTVTSLATADQNDSIVLSCGSIRQVVALTTKESAIGVSSYGYFFDQSLAASKTVTVSGDLFGAVNLVAPSGITLSESSVSAADAVAGKTITLTWDGSTRIENEFIQLRSGTKMDSVLVFAVNNSLVSGWDGDTVTVAPSKLTDFGWSQTLADGTAGAPAWGEYMAGGVRLVTAVNANHTYKGKYFDGYRTAYLRTWGNPGTNVYNLAVNIAEANKLHTLRGIVGWHNNENNPVVKVAINTAKSNLGDTLGIQSVACTVRQRGEDFGFNFMSHDAGTYYLTISTNSINDCLIAPDFLAVYLATGEIGTGMVNQETAVKVYPTVANGSVMIQNAAKSNLQLFDISGKMIVNQKVSTDLETLNIPQAGMYFVRVNDKVFKVINK